MQSNLLVSCRFQDTRFQDTRTRPDSSRQEIFSNLPAHRLLSMSMAWRHFWVSSNQKHPKFLIPAHTCIVSRPCPYVYQTHVTVCTIDFQLSSCEMWEWPGHVHVTVFFFLSHASTMEQLWPCWLILLQSRTLTSSLWSLVRCSSISLSLAMRDYISLWLSVCQAG